MCLFWHDKIPCSAGAQSGVYGYAESRSLWWRTMASALWREPTEREARSMEALNRCGDSFFAPSLHAVSSACSGRGAAASAGNPYTTEGQSSCSTMIRREASTHLTSNCPCPGAGQRWAAWPSGCITRW